LRGKIICPKCGEIGRLELQSEDKFRINHDYMKNGVRENNRCYLGSLSKSLINLVNASETRPDFLEPILIDELKSKINPRQNILNEIKDSAYATLIARLIDLSHDDVIRKDITTNKINGKNQLQRTAYKGFPAVIYCSAKDEISRDETEEMNTRFNTVSIKGSTKKYKQILNLVLQNDDPTQEIISQNEIKETKSKVERIIENIKAFHGVFNPFAQNIADNFPCDRGSRARQLKTLSNTIKMLTLSRSEDKFSIIKDDKQFLISSKSDVIEAVQMIKEANPIAVTKIQFFNEKIRPFLLGRLDKSPAIEIAEHLESDRKKILETYLTPYVEHGYLEKEQDPDNRSRDLYSLSLKYEKQQASIFSTLIDVSTIDISCLKNTLECRLEQGYKIVSSKGEVCSIDDVVNNQEVIDTIPAESIPKINSVDMSNSVDNLGDVQ